MAVSKNQRALLIVNSLSKHSTGPLEFIYTFTENSAITVAQSVLGDDYKSITVRQGAHSTRARFLTALQNVVTADGITAVDVFMQLHGSKDKFHFYDEAVEASTLRDQIRNLGLPDRLRLLYNTGCYGDSQNHREMIEAGFTTTVGSKRINATGATEYPTFCSLWQFGNTVRDVVRAADNAPTRAVQDAAARAFSSKFQDANSQKVIRGKSDLTISSSA